MVPIGGVAYVRDARGNIEMSICNRWPQNETKIVEHVISREGRSLSNSTMYYVREIRFLLWKLLIDCM